MILNVIDSLILWFYFSRSHILTVSQECLCMGEEERRKMYSCLAAISCWSETYVPSVFKFLSSSNLFGVGTKCYHVVLCLSINRKSGQRAKCVHWIREERNRMLQPFEFGQDPCKDISVAVASCEKLAKGHWNRLKNLKSF